MLMYIECTDSMSTLISSYPHQVGGCKAGTFEPYPTHSTDPYGTVKPHKGSSDGKGQGVFRPSPGPKTMATRSIVQQHVVRCV